MDLVVSENLAALEGQKVPSEPTLLKTLAKATGIFLVVSVGSFLAINGKALIQQASDHFAITQTASDLLTDADHDGLPDWWERKYAFDPQQGGDQSGDPDGEQLVNLAEFTYSTDPRNPDTDGDRFDDKTEIDRLYDPLVAGAVRLDFDHDSLPDWWEKQYGFIIGNDESRVDPDSDGLTNLEEFKYGTDPLNADTDGDGIKDRDEITKGSDPLGKGLLDTDGDGLTDREEVQLRTDTRNRDTDADGLSDFDEVRTYGTNPLVPDTDGDGFSDKSEVEAGFDPLKGGGAKLTTRDADKDGLTAAQEEAIGTDPNRADTDGDGLTDALELQKGLDPTADSNPATQPTAAVHLPKINVSAPIVWVAGTTEADYQKGLEKGVIHLPQTPFPGLPGNSYITGHSSDYVFKAGNYKEVFAGLASEEVGDTVEIILTYHSGKQVTQNWRMFLKDVVAPDDPRLFEQTATPVLTLATCWPLNTSWQRIMERYELVDDSKP